MGRRLIEFTACTDHRGGSRVFSFMTTLSHSNTLVSVIWCCPTRSQIEHKRLKVQHKKDKERDRYVTPSPRMMQAAAGAGGRVQQPQHFRQPLLPQHTSALRHHSVRNVFPTMHLCSLPSLRDAYFCGIKLLSCDMVIFDSFVNSAWWLFAGWTNATTVGGSGWLTLQACHWLIVLALDIRHRWKECRF